MPIMQFICDICKSTLFIPLYELEVIETNGNYKIIQSNEVQCWKCQKCGEIHPSTIDISTQKIYKLKEDGE